MRHLTLPLLMFLFVLVLLGCTEKPIDTTSYQIPVISSYGTEVSTEIRTTQETSEKSFLTDSTTSTLAAEPTQNLTENATEVVETVPGMEIVESTELIVNGNAEIGG